MVLLSFCKKYIFQKALNQTGAYALSDSKAECAHLLRSATSFALLINSVQYCKKLELHTTSNYVVVIKFCIYAKSVLFPYGKKPFDTEFVNDYLWVLTCKKSISTKFYYQAIIRAFANKYNKDIHSYCEEIDTYCEKYHELKADIFYILSQKELKKIVLGLEGKSEKQKLMYLLLLQTGMRVSEMLNLKKIDFRWMGELCLIEVKGKGGFFRFAPIKSVNIKSLFIELSKNKALDEYIFTDKKGMKISRQYVYKMVQIFLAGLGIFKIQNGPHLFRHTFASLLYEKNKDLVLTQEILGHKNATSTLRYIHMNKINLMKMAEALDIKYVAE